MKAGAGDRNRANRAAAGPLVEDTDGGGCGSIDIHRGESDGGPVGECVDVAVSQGIGSGKVRSGSGSRESERGAAGGESQGQRCLCRAGRLGSESDIEGGLLPRAQLERRGSPRDLKSRTAYGGRLQRTGGGSGIEHGHYGGGGRIQIGGGKRDGAAGCDSRRGAGRLNGVAVGEPARGAVQREREGGGYRILAVADDHLPGGGQPGSGNILHREAEILARIERRGQSGRGLHHRHFRGAGESNAVDSSAGGACVLNRYDREDRLSSSRRGHVHRTARGNVGGGACHCGSNLQNLALRRGCHGECGGQSNREEGEEFSHRAASPGTK